VIYLANRFNRQSEISEVFFLSGTISRQFLACRHFPKDGLGRQPKSVGNDGVMLALQTR